MRRNPFGIIWRSTERDKTFYENKCATLDRQIDQLVYDLYDLTDDEIAIIEKA